MKKIIINGANGYVASNFIRRLLEQNNRVTALVRSNGTDSAYERMTGALRHNTYGDYLNTRNLEVIDYDLSADHFAIPEDQLKQIFSGETDYYHFAASLKYDLRSKEEIFRTNLEGMKNSLKIYSQYAGPASRFFFISTAYSCGHTQEVFREEFYENADISHFRNYYEQSKRFAENVVREFIEEKNIRVHILRMSQVVGESRTGITKTDYGIFDFAKRVNSLSVRYPGHTIRLQVDPDSTQNLIPIDTVVYYLMRTVEMQTLPVIMNMVARRSVKNISIINSLCQLLPIDIVPVETLEKNEMTALERIIASGMSFTGNYVHTNIHFDTSRLQELGIPEGAEIDDETVFKMLRYFLRELKARKGAAVA